MKLRREVMLAELGGFCVVVASLALGSAAAEGPCERHRSWWDRERSACIPCTRCEPQQVVRLPCELYRDTICQPLSSLSPNIWSLEPNNDSASDYADYYEEYTDADYDASEEGAVRWDVETATLTLAASGCAVFFVVVLFLSFYHSKQWKVLKQAVRSDVQDLSAKLTLMEAGDAPAEPVVPTDHHIYCNIHVAKDALIGPTAAKLGLVGNVYTQEKQPY